MIKNIHKFIHNEDGAVTVDWVVLTAMVVVLAGVAMASLNAATGGLGEGVSEYMASFEFD